jgi:TRAP-type transport system small permease protein
MNAAKAVSALFKSIEAVLAFLLLGMVLMVFGNVVLRYGFNSGITVSEELSRYFFVWLTFIGAIVAMHDGTHLGMDNVVSKLSRRGKLVCLAICQVLILVCCVMLFWGTFRQHEVNATTRAPVTGMSMIWVFGVGYLTSLAMVAHALHKLWRIYTGQITDSELIEISDSEEAHAPAGGPGGSNRPGREDAK